MCPFFFSLGYHKTRQIDMLIQFALVQVTDRQLQVIFQLDGAPPHQRHWELGIMRLYWNYVVVVLFCFLHFLSFWRNGIPINLLSHRDDQSLDFFISGLWKGPHLVIIVDVNLFLNNCPTGINKKDYYYCWYQQKPVICSLILQNTELIYL